MVDLLLVYMLSTYIHRLYAGSIAVTMREYCRKAL